MVDEKAWKSSERFLFPLAIFDEFLSLFFLCCSPICCGKSHLPFLTAKKLWLIDSTSHPLRRTSIFLMKLWPRFLKKKKQFSALKCELTSCAYMQMKMWVNWQRFTTIKIILSRLVQFINVTWLWHLHWCYPFTINHFKWKSFWPLNYM